MPSSSSASTRCKALFSRVVATCRRPFPNGLLTGLFLVLAGAAYAQTGAAPTNPWRDDNTAQRGGAASAVPELRSYRALLLDAAALQATLAAAPRESAAGPATGPVLVLPLPNGSSERFRVVETQVMAPALAARYPSIKTYSGVGLDDPTATLRCDFTPRGFHAQVLSDRTDAFYIDPLSATDPLHYVAYYPSEVRLPTGVRCGNQDTTTPLPSQPRRNGGSGALRSDELPEGSGPSAISAGPVLRTYRLAIGTTAEFTNNYGSATNAQSVVTTAVNQVIGIMEKELAVRLDLAGTVIYTNAATDIYTNPDSHTQLIADNQAGLTPAAVGGAFDVAQVFGISSMASGGLAALNSVCNPTRKAQGSTGFAVLTVSQIATNVLAHELGHQFGATHTFNPNTSICSGQRTGSSAWEPGGGTTIMGYATGCGTPEYGAAPNYHTGNFEQIQTFIQNTGTCATTAATGNTLPTVSAPPTGRTLPANTPFRLTATGADADGDPLTYSWEELDLGSAADIDAPQVAGDAVPLFRVRPPMATATRYFPPLPSILTSTFNANGERLPTVTRPLTFRCGARDQHNGSQGVVGGVVYSDLVSLSVTSAAGPFAVTAPNTAVSWAGNSTQTVTWDVAGTTANGVNCATVNIRLSTDGGATFPVLLAAGVPNDGSQDVTTPNVASTTARVMVEAADNYFLDVSNANFTLTTVPGPAITGLSPARGPVGTAFTISGSGFTGTTAVTVGGVAATFTVANASTINATVPAAALTGPVQVTNGGVTTTGSTFQVTPVLSSLSASSGAVGSSLTLTGTSFGGATGVTFFNGVTVPASSFTSSSLTPGATNTITVTVPVGAQNGPVFVTTAGGNSNGLLFVTEPFAISSRSPARNALTGSALGPVTLTFSQAPSSATAAGTPISIFSSQRGGRRNGSGAFSATGNSVSFKPNVGDGFRPGETISVTTTVAASSSVGAAIAAAETYQFTVAAGRATGALGNLTNLTTGARPQNVALGDVNGDGKLDLVAANSDNGNGTTVSVRLGDGTGAFGAGSAELTVGSYPEGLVLADINNDGRLDILVACAGSNAVYVLVRNASGSAAGDFAAATTLAVGAFPEGVAVADFNNDGWLDVAATNGYNNTARIHRFLNAKTAAGTFGTSTFFDLAGGYCYALAAADLNNDGNQDLLVTYSDASLNAVGVALGNGQGAFTGQPAVAVGNTPMGLAVGDLNNDGNLDFATANMGGNNISLRLGNGAGGFAAPAVPEIAVGSSQQPMQVALADLDGDGDLDFAATNYLANPGQLSVRLGNGNGSFTAPATPEYNTASQCYGLTVADINNDGALDVVTGNFGSTGAEGASVLRGVALPTVSAISPGSGSVGSAVTIYGSGFTAASTATIGGVALTGVTVNTTTTPQTLAGTVGSGTPLGAQPVVVTTGANVSNSSITFNVTAPLPVELVAFTATADGPAAVQLAWRTASEKNNAGFDVERSIDGQRFAHLAWVPAAGPVGAAYAHQDAALPADVRVLYYRLRQTDIGGQAAYSPVRTVKFTNSPTCPLTAYPNPARRAVTITGAGPGAAVQVLNALGQLVLKATADATGTAALAWPAALPAGVYVVRCGGQAQRLIVAQ